MGSTSPVGVAGRLQRSGKSAVRQPGVTAAPVQSRPGSIVTPARAGDHLAIHRFLLDVFQGPSTNEYTAQLENPFYEPSDRLIIKHRNQIIGHVRLQQEQMRFGDPLIPITRLTELAIAPEYRQRSIGSLLLQAAEAQLVREGSLVGMLETNVPAFYQRHGWTLSHQPCYSTADARGILSYLGTHQPRDRRIVLDDQANSSANPYNIRLWRHVEQDALIHLYNRHTAGCYGPLERNEDYWRWLFSRRGYDRIYVAINGPDKIELDQSLKAIVAYAIIKQGRILEIMTSPGHDQAGHQLVKRVCADVIEQEDGPIRIDAPPGDPLHAFMVSSGGHLHHQENHAGTYTMAKLFDSLAVLKALQKEINQRAHQANLNRPFELGLEIHGKWHQILFTPRSIKLVPGKSGRSHLRCDDSVLAQLLMGYLDVPQAVEEGLLQASTRVAAETAQVIFPRLPLWRPPLDDAPA